MCERSPLFLLEVKSILFDLLHRSVELFDLFRHLIEHYRLSRFLSQREQQPRQFSLRKPCRLNYNIISDLDIYLHRLYTTCRLTKSSLRSLHAARMTSTNDYIVVDDQIYELLKFFRSKLHQFQSRNKQSEQPTKISKRRYHSQRLVHSSQSNQPFVFHPETFYPKNNSQKTILPSSDSEDIEEHPQTLESFRKISHFYGLLLEQFYGVHLVRDTHIFQPIVIGIIQLLLLITNQLKENVQFISPTLIRHNRFTVQQNEEVCHEQKMNLSGKTKFQFMEIPPENMVTSKLENTDQNVEYVRNDNHLTGVKEDEASILEFDEDEFYRLANLEWDN